MTSLISFFIQDVLYSDYIQRMYTKQHMHTEYEAGPPDTQIVEVEEEVMRTCGKKNI